MKFAATKECWKLCLPHDIMFASNDIETDGKDVFCLRNSIKVCRKFEIHDRVKIWSHTSVWCLPQLLEHALVVCSDLHSEQSGVGRIDCRVHYGAATRLCNQSSQAMEAQWLSRPATRSVCKTVACNICGDVSAAKGKEMNLQPVPCLQLECIGHPTNGNIQNSSRFYRLSFYSIST